MSVRTLVYFEGSLEYYLESRQNNWVTIPDVKQPKMSETKPIELKQSYALLIVLGFGISFSIIAFAIEFFWGNLEKTAKNRDIKWAVANSGMPAETVVTRYAAQ